MSWALMMVMRTECFNGYVTVANLQLLNTAVVKAPLSGDKKAWKKQVIEGSWSAADKILSLKSPTFTMMILESSS